MKNVISLAFLSTAFSGLFQASPALDALTPPEPRPDSEMHRRSLALVEEVRQRGDTALPKLARSFSSLAYEYRDYALDLLQAMGTEEARALLLDAAYGRLAGAEHLTESAASLYLNSMSEPREAVRLLDAEDTIILNRALVALRGLPLEAILLRKLDHLLQSDELAVRHDALQTVRYAAPSDEATAAAAASTVLSSIESRAQLPRQDAPVVNWGGGWIEHFSRMDAFLIRATHALAYSEAIDASALRQLAPPTPGLVRECVIVALGIRGDATVLPEYRRLMEHSIRPGIRLVAVEGFQKLAKPDDLELLDRIRLQDPFMITLREEGGHFGLEAPHPGGGHRAVHPIRFYASQAASQLRPTQRPSPESDP